MLKQMWEKLDAFTIAAGDGAARDINVRNEWGGFGSFWPGRAGRFCNGLN